MELFKDNFTPLQIRVQDCNNNEHIVRTKMLTPKKVRQIEELESNKDMKDGEAITKTLLIMFDKSAEFWDNFSLEFITKLISHANGDRKKKLKTETESDMDGSKK
jgi:hypothetical protein